MLLILSIILIGCEKPEALPPLAEFEFDSAIIKVPWESNSVNNTNLEIDIETWEYINDDMILIRSTIGKTYVTDQTNVIFIIDDK